jgi:tetratricopeptide (TPR) repeat protein
MRTIGPLGLFINWEKFTENRNLGKQHFLAKSEGGRYDGNNQTLALFSGVFDIDCSPTHTSTQNCESTMIFRFYKPIFLALFFSITLCSLGLCEETPQKTEKKEEETVSNDADIEKLIEQLGSPRYTEREHAEKELLKLNIEAFLPLFRAKKHADPEIAARARYLVRKIQTNLIMPGDSAKVAGLMRNIFSLDYNQQWTRILQLSKLSKGEGLDALCRLIIFCESEITAKMAALGIIQAFDQNYAQFSSSTISREKIVGPAHNGLAVRLVQDDDRKSRPPKTDSANSKEVPGKSPGSEKREKIRRQLKSCGRSAAKLVLTYFDLENAETEAEKKTLYKQWHKICLEEEKAAQKYTTSRSSSSVNTLLLSLLEIQLQKAHELQLEDDEQTQVVLRILEKNHIWKHNNFGTIATRLLNEKAWKLADMSIPEFAEVIQKSYNNSLMPRFFCLMIRSGKTKSGDELFELYANRFQFVGSRKTKELMTMADLLNQEGLTERSLKRYQIAIDNEIIVRNSAPERLPCWEAFEHVMKIHEENEQFELADKTAKQMLEKIKEIPESKQARTAITELSNQAQSYSAYYRAIAAKKKGNEAEYRKLLDEAIKLTPEEPKVLAECYHLPVTTPEDKKFHDQIVQQIARTVRTLTNNANRKRRSHTAYQNYQLYNAKQAAWLTVNTEGSLLLVTRTLESMLKRYPNPNKTDPEGYEILARCYQKKDELDKAVTHAQKAIESAPYSKRTRKTWEEIAAAYEKEKGVKPLPPKTGIERFRKLVNLPAK